VTVRSGGSTKAPLSVQASGPPTVGTSSAGRQASAPAAGSSGSVASSVGGASGASGAGGGSAPAGTYGALGPGYGQLPPIEGAQGAHVRARIARRERVLKATVARFQGCLADLPSTQRQLLELRTGLGPLDPLAPKAAAARLHIAPSRVAQIERRALRELRSAGSTGGCSRMGQIVAGVGAFIARGIGGTGGGPGASSGVLGARYEKAAPSGTVAPKTPRSSGALLGVGIPDVDLLLLLLIPLIVIGLTILDLITRGRRRGPLEKYVNRVLAAGHASARRRGNVRGRR